MYVHDLFRYIRNDMETNGTSRADALDIYLDSCGYFTCTVKKIDECA